MPMAVTSALYLIAESGFRSAVASLLFPEGGMPLSGLIRIMLAPENESGPVSLLYWRPGAGGSIGIWCWWFCRHLVECSGSALEKLLVISLDSA